MEHKIPGGIQMMLYEQNTLSLHSHNFLELVYVLEGSAWHLTDKQKTRVQKGNFFIIDYCSRHGYEKNGLRPMKIMNCLFLPELIDKTLKHCNRLGEVMNNYQLRYHYRPTNKNPADLMFYDTNGRIGRLIEEMYAEFEQKQAGYIEILRCKLIEILITMMRNMQTGSEAEDGSIEGHMVSFVLENYMNPVRLGQLAKETNYSLPYLSRIFRERFGMTFEQFLQKTRVEQSCRLLANSDKKVTEIAGCVGYTDQKSFTAVFKKIMGMTPRDYRKKYR